MGADNTFGETNFNPDKTICHGEWINDCPFVTCHCAKNILTQKQLDEDYNDEAIATSRSLLRLGCLFFTIIIIMILVVVMS